MNLDKLILEILKLQDNAKKAPEGSTKDEGRYDSLHQAHGVSCGGLTSRSSDGTSRR
jgi:hypothetical protein